MSEKNPQGYDGDRGVTFPTEASILEKENHYERQPVNVGEPPIHSRLGRGETERYEMCEDAKINDPEHGLFLVADGVSGSRGKNGAGEFASRETAWRVQALLGENLDRGIGNIVRAKHLDLSEKQQKIHVLIESHMRLALQLADEKIRDERKKNVDFIESATTATLAKIVDMPSGDKLLFLMNIGDSRAFLEHDGKLHKLTTDDSFVAADLGKQIGLDNMDLDTPQQRAQKEHLFQQQLQQIEQAPSVDHLPADLRKFFRFRHIITSAVGDGKAFEKARMQKFKLQNGDRLLLASDGLTDVLFEQEIAGLLKSSANDRETERLLQNASDEIAFLNNRPRAKADDVAAVVFTIAEMLHEDEVFLEEDERPGTVPVDHPSSEVNLQDLQNRLKAVSAEISSLLSHLDFVQEKNEKRSMELQIVELEIVEANMESQISLAEYRNRSIDAKRASQLERILEGAPKRLMALKQKRERLLRQKEEDLVQSARDAALGQFRV